MKIDKNKKVIIVPDYVKHKAELDELCREHGWAYEIRADGSARIIRYCGEVV